jgi:predicted enzyme related to lactoylglutathione lyase
VFATFVVPAPAAVDDAAGRVEALGGRLLKAPFQTYYGQWQTVLADPEGHACRVSCLTLPS